MVCVTIIYHYIQQDKAAGGELYKSLRHEKSYKKRTGLKDKRGQIIGRISIDERPAIVDSKERLWDLEAFPSLARGMNAFS
jgi:IS30 family transposase